MKPLTCVLLVTASLFATSTLAAQAPLASLIGPYLGQALPGATPVIFAPGIVSMEGRHEYACGFRPDNKAFIFTATLPQKSSTLMICEMKGDAWMPPRELRLGESTMGEMEGCFAPDGKTVFFVVYEEKGCAIWKATQKGSVWSKAQKLGPAINTGITFYPSLTSNGTLYFTDVKQRKTCMSVPANGDYLTAEPAGIEFGVHAFVTRDDRTLVMDSNGDIYACFRLKNGKWSTPRKLGSAINTPNYSETCPSLSPDGRLLFFSRYNEKDEISNLYWVSSAELDSLRRQAESE